MNNRQIDYRLKIDETWLIKAFAIIAMLVHHLFFEHPEFGDTIVNIAWIGKVCVALFVFLSGYGMAASFPKNILGRLLLTKTFFFVICKRYTKFFLNYWIIFFVSIPIGTFFFGRPLEAAYGEDANLLTSFINDMFGQQSFNSYNTTWWFNAIILALWLLFPFIYLIMKSKFISILLLLIFFFNFNDFLHILHFVAPRLPDYVFTFSLGIFIALHISKINKILNIVHPYIIFISSFVTASVLLFLRGFPVFPKFTDLSVEPFATPLVALTTVSLCRLTKKKFGFMQFIGKHSMNIYLTHTFIVGYFFADFIYGFKYPIMIFLALLTSSLLLSICIEFIKKRIYFYEFQGKIIGIIKKFSETTLKEGHNIC